MQTTNPTWQRRNNLAVLARAVWQAPGLSRRDLDSRFQIDKSSISRLVQVLIDQGLVETAGRLETPEGARPAPGGRPRVALRVRAEYGQVWGLALWPDKARLTILDARGEVRLVDEKRFGAYDGQWDRYLSQALEFAAEAAASLGLPVLGIGFGVPGWVDSSQGRILDSFQFSLQDLRPLASWPASFPLVWENDANCGAWSCRAAGDLVSGKSRSDNLYVLGRFIENGPMGVAREFALGLGLVIAGRLHRGWRHRVGEYRSSQWNPGQRSVFGISDADFVEAWDDPAAFRAVAADLVRHLRTFTELLDPRTIHLGGDLKFRSEALAEAAAALGWPQADKLFHPLAPESDEVSLGAAQLVLDEVFQLPSASTASLFRDWGTEGADVLWRGLSVPGVRSLISGGR